MGSGISSMCGSSRSVLISNSVRKLPTIPEADIDSENDLEINPRSGKLHPAESRDSGIGENDIPNGFLFQKNNGSGFLKSSSAESSPDKNKDHNSNNSEKGGSNPRPSRPQSCRLGHRGHVVGRSRRGQNGQGSELSDSQIRRLVRSARGQPGVPLKDGIGTDGGCSDDTLSCGSSSSPTREVKPNARPKSARRRVQKRHKGSERRNSAKTISDLDSSTDTEISDTDMLSIPDETGAFSQSKDTTPRHRGWVRNEDFTDVMLTSSASANGPGGIGAGDMYRIVSGTYSDIDVSLAKKASERSISSILLTPMDGFTTPTNSECCCDSPNDMYFHCDGSLDDLITSLMSALDRQGTRGRCTAADYEAVIRALRYQLVAMAMGHSCQQVTPRIEVKGEQHGLFSDDTWRVQIRLRTEDEEIIESSENILVQRLVAKGRGLTREDLSILLAEHLKTIEKLQHVHDAGKIGTSRDSPLGFQLVSPRPNTVDGSSEGSATVDESMVVRLNTRPYSDSRTKRANQSQSQTQNSKASRPRDLPPIGRQRNNAGKGKGDNSSQKKAADSAKAEFDSSASSPESKAKDRRSFNESGIDSEADDIDLQGIEDEDTCLTTEFAEAIVLLWETLTSSDLSDLLAEYRKREGRLLTPFTKHRKQVTADEASAGDNSGGPCSKATPTESMGQHMSHADDALAGKEVRQLDEEFVRRFQERHRAGDSSLEDFCGLLDEHMKKTRVIRVQSFSLDGGAGRSEADMDWSSNKRAHSFTGLGTNAKGNPVGESPTPLLKRQNSFAGSVSRQSSSIGGLSRHNSFIRSLPGSRQGSYYRTKSRGSTGSSNTFSTSSSGISSGVNSVTSSDGSGHYAPKSGISREFSYGLLNDFEDIEELDETVKTAREREAAAANESPTKARLGSDSLRPPSGRRSNGSRATSGNMRGTGGAGVERGAGDRRRGQQTHVHGLGMTGAESPSNAKPLRRIEEDSLPKVEEIDSGKMVVRSRPDSGIAVSTSSASYSSSEPHRDRDRELEEPCCSLTTSCQEMVDKVAKVLAEQHSDMKSLVAAVTKGLNSGHAKAQALYCWLAAQTLTSFEKISKKSSSPAGRLKQLCEKKTSYSTLYMDMLKVAGLKCEKVEGYVKSGDYLPGNTVQSAKFQHSWVAVSIDGHFRLVDPQYGAQGGKFHLDHFFAPSPDALILSHFPKDKRWLLMNQPATIEGFEGTVKTWPAMFHFNIRPLNMKSVVRTYDGRLSITVLLQNVAVNPQLEYAGPGKEIDSDTLEEHIDHEIRDVDNAETYHVTLPQEGNYYFTVHAHVLEDCIDVPVFQYRIEYKDELL